MNVNKRDLVLINKIKNEQDSYALNELYDTYKKILYAYILKRYDNLNDVDDVISEILIKVFTNINDFDENKGSFINWVYNIANRTIIDQYRKSYVDSVSLSSEYIDMPNKLDHSIQYEIKNTLDYINGNVGVSDYDWLNMHYIQGYSYKEIGDEYNVTSTTVSNRVNYVKKKIKNEMELDY